MTQARSKQNQNAHLTFKQNLQKGRHGWLRLTPAYSYSLVHAELEHLAGSDAHVFDPFSGSGTTGLVAAEIGLRATLTEINPFLVWFGNVKFATYSAVDSQAGFEVLAAIRSVSLRKNARSSGESFPPIHNIERWWDLKTLRELAQVHAAIASAEISTKSRNLLLVAFCRTLIKVSNASFGHQSMSFKTAGPAAKLLFDTEQTVISIMETEFRIIAEAAEIPLQGSARVLECDARDPRREDVSNVDFICTSPPYANRMSYIRELRPYMYWLGYLKESREAGELDWEAIGGTWGIATSRLNDWVPTPVDPIESSLRRVEEAIIATGRKNSLLLSRYVRRYFVDAWAHLSATIDTLRTGGRGSYIVGNSTFYGVEVPTHEWYRELMDASGYSGSQHRIVRKRNSNKALYEYIVSGEKSNTPTSNLEAEVDVSKLLVRQLKNIEGCKPKSPQKIVPPAYAGSIQRGDRLHGAEAPC